MRENLLCTFVWKQEWSAVRNGCFADSANMRRSVIVHSTSSSSMITCFFSTFIANSSAVCLCCANNTCTSTTHIGKQFILYVHYFSITHLSFTRHRHQSYQYINIKNSIVVWHLCKRRDDTSKTAKITLL